MSGAIVYDDRPVSYTSALDAIDFPPTAIDQLVIVRHRLQEALVGHEPLLDGEEILDLLDLRLSDDGARHRRDPALVMIRSRFSGCMNAGNGLDPVIAE